MLGTNFLTRRNIPDSSQIISKHLNIIHRLMIKSIKFIWMSTLPSAQVSMAKSLLVHQNRYQQMAKQSWLHVMTILIAHIWEKYLLEVLLKSVWQHITPSLQEIFIILCTFMDLNFISWLGFLFWYNVTGQFYKKWSILDGKPLI